MTACRVLMTQLRLLPIKKGTFPSLARLTKRQKKGEGFLFIGLLYTIFEVGCGRHVEV